jgi:hypothetical protein
MKHKCEICYRSEKLPPKKQIIKIKSRAVGFTSLYSNNDEYTIDAHTVGTIDYRFITTSII